MYALSAQLTTALAAGVTAIVPSRQRAAAVRLAYASQQLRDGRRVWNSPDVITWEAWLAREMLRARQVSGEGPVLLNRSQELELWRQALCGLAQDGEQEQLFVRHSEALADAARLAREWRLRWPSAGATEEAALLGQAMQAMDGACRERGLAIVSLLQDDALARLGPTALFFAGVCALTPRQASLARMFTQAGMTVTIAADDAPVTPTDGPATEAFSFGSAVDEAAAIATWCRSSLAADPFARLLVVCADARIDAASVQEAVANALGDGEGDDVALEGGEPLANHPVVVAALAVFELGQDEIAFETLSTVLLSPHLASGGTGLRLELALRERLPDRCDVAAILEELARCGKPLQVAAAALAEVIRTARETLTHRRPIAPLEWARELTNLLARAGHGKGRPLASKEMQAWQRWQATLEEFASLGTVLPAVTAGEAVARLRALLRRAEHRAASGDAPVTITASLGDPIVRYDAIWVSGLAETQWPQAPRLDPFLPAALQRQAGVPGASAALRLAEARSQLRAWQAAAGTRLRLSHARADGDIDQAPSVLLQDLPIIAIDSPRRSRTPVGQGQARPAEPSVQPRRAGDPLQRAGSRLPELQRDCPFRAQAELRLGARELAAPRIGIDARLRGLLVHRAMENLWQSIRTGATLRSRPPEGWQAEIDAAVHAAFDGAQSKFGAPPTHRQQVRERERCKGLLVEALRLESARTGDYSVVASESRLPWNVAGAQLSLRIDRLDRLPDGSVVIIDYKTGNSAKLELLDAAPRPVQLLAYLDATGGDVAALALMKLVPGMTAFDSLEDGRAGLPQSRRRGGAPTPAQWPALVAQWRADVRGLVARHLEGDARVLPLRNACDHCALPALCRVDARALRASLEAASDDDDADPQAGEGSADG